MSPFYVFSLKHLFRGRFPLYRQDGYEPLAAAENFPDPRQHVRQAERARTASLLLFLVLLLK
jgi:hypothetical protein